MARVDAHVFEVPANIARSYKIPKGRDPLKNGAGVTAIMGLTNGRGAARRARRSRGTIKAKRGGATCWTKPRTKYMRMGATHRSDYAYPECWAYPVKSHRSKKTSKLLVSAAAKWFRVHGTKYSPSVRAKIASRIDTAARREGVRGARLRNAGRGRWARSNGGESMIVLESASSGYEENRRRRHARAPKKGSCRMSYGYRSNEDESSSDASDVSIFEAVENRRGSRRRSSKRRGKGRGRKSARRIWGSKGRSARRVRKGTRRHAARRTWGRKSRKSSRKARKSTGRRWGRKSARRSSSKRRGGRKSYRRSYGEKGRRSSKRRGSKRGYRRNGFEGNPPLSAAQRAYLAQARAARGAYGGMPKDAAGRAAYSARQHASIAQRRAGVGAFRSPWAQTPFRGWDAPWNRARNQAKLQRKLQRQAERAARMGRVMPAVYGGISPRDIAMGRKELTKRQFEAIFPERSMFTSWMGTMRGAKKFRKWSSKGRKSRRWGGKRRGGYRAAARFGRGRRRWGRGKKRFGRGKRRFGRGKRRFGRGKRRFGRRSWGKGRRRGSRRFGRGRRRGYRRNYMANMPFLSFGQMAAAAAIGFGTFAIPYYVNIKSSPLITAALGLGLGAVAVYASDKIFTQTDAYAKAMAVGGIIGMILSAGRALMAAFKPAGTAGFGGPAFSNQYARYALQGPFQQAMAGNFQQAMAGNPFQQAQAGFGEYIGTGEYTSTDGNLSAVSDFGEYVTQGVAVEGYGDYEVSSSYRPGADGYGAINEGVLPFSNMDREFDIMEAAAGLGASPSGRSDYVPTVGASNVGGQESSPDAGIFDVGGPNGVFG